MQAADPLAVAAVGLGPALDLAGERGGGHDGLEPGLHQGEVEDVSVDAAGLHRHRGDPAPPEPGDEVAEAGGVGGELADRVGPVGGVADAGQWVASPTSMPAACGWRTGAATRRATSSASRRTRSAWLSAGGRGFFWRAGTADSRMGGREPGRASRRGSRHGNQPIQRDPPRVRAAVTIGGAESAPRPSRTHGPSGNRSTHQKRDGPRRRTRHQGSRRRPQVPGPGGQPKAGRLLNQSLQPTGPVAAVSVGVARCSRPGG